MEAKLGEAARVFGPLLAFAGVLYFAIIRPLLKKRSNINPNISTPHDGQANTSALPPAQPNYDPPTPGMQKRG